MAYTFSVNNTPATGAEAIWLLVTTLVAAGWVVKSDSDGATYAPAGGQVTGSGGGAHGLANPNAWIRIQAPATNGGSVLNQHRELTFQRGADSRYWRLKYSASANFTLGLPSAAATPSAADEVILYGAGTDAVPTWPLIWFSADASYRWHIACGGLAESYSFYAFALPNTTTQTGNGIFLDVMQPGSYPDGLDVDPAVIYCGDEGSVGFQFGSLSTFSILSSDTIVNRTNPCLATAWLGPTSYVGIATVGTNNQQVCLFPYGGGSGGGFPMFGGATAGSVNPWTGNDDVLPAWWARAGNSTPPNGIKGKSTLFLFGSKERVNMDTGSLLAVRDFIHNSSGGAAAASHSLWLPWSGAVVTL